MIENIVSAYGNLDSNHIEAIKREVGMKYSGNTITEYYELYAEDREKIGEKRGEKRGEDRGSIKGKLATLQSLLDDGVIDQPYFDKVSAPLLQQLSQLDQPSKGVRKAAVSGRSART